MGTSAAKHGTYQYPLGPSKPNAAMTTPTMAGMPNDMNNKPQSYWPNDILIPWVTNRKALQ